ncbi:MAG TPA: HAD-IIA family hydrolase [Anaerolineaceae bacterium]|nr:HAD-IIA family hydrolase [Anaerolineaceae bacterium]
MLNKHFPELKGLILDMDGVLWKDRESIGDLPLIFSTISCMGLRVVVATNNAAMSVDEYLQKFAGFGVNLLEEQIVTSATVTIAHLKKHFEAGTAVYVVGSTSLMRMVTEAGFHLSNHDSSPKAEAVVVGLDREMTYDRIHVASKLVRHGASFLACNTDATYPTPAGVKPGAGVMVAAIQTASGVQPIILGKPMPYPYEEALRYLGCLPSEAMGIGDRLSTDIAGAQAAGCLSGFVCSGVDPRAEAEAWQPPMNIIADDLWSLLNA